MLQHQPDDVSVTAHPTLETLAAFSAGRLDEASIAQVEGHLSHCAVCRDVLKAIPLDRFTALLQTSATDSEPDAQGVVPDLPPGFVDHPRYRVVTKLGEGGMGVVYKAEHRLMKRFVALKVVNACLSASPAAVARFRREVEALAKVNHPDIAVAYDADEVGGHLVLVEEYVEGTDLAHVVRERGPVPVAEACGWVRRVALALQHAHERGLVHRDIKPANVMVTGTGQVKVLDFGLASLHGEDGSDPTPDPPTNSGSRSLTDFGQGIGTADFAAPEQVRDSHTADARSDIYSLGGTLFFLLTGHPIKTRGVDRSNLPRGLDGVLDRMTAVSPTERFPSMSEVANALVPFVDGNGRRLSRRSMLILSGTGLIAAPLAVGLLRRPNRKDAFLPVPSANRSLHFRRTRDTIHVHEGTVVGTAATYEARVLFPANEGSYGAVFNEWINDGVDQYLGIGPDKIDAALFPHGWIGHNRPLTRDVWHHVAWVYDGAELRLYLDGAVVARKPAKGNVGCGTTVASVGAVWRPPEETPRAGFVGYLDTLRVSRVARYAGEQFDPPHGKLPTDADTLLLFNFNDPPDSGTVTDESGHGRTGTLGIGFNGASRPDIEDRP